MCAKSRVAPVKTQTIPRLEHLGAVLLALLMDSVMKALSGVISIDNVFYWTDSITVVRWIRKNKNWKQYVMRRVEEIRKLSLTDKWNHCSGFFSIDIGNENHIGAVYKSCNNSPQIRCGTRKMVV